MAVIYRWQGTNLNLADTPFPNTTGYGDVACAVPPSLTYNFGGALHGDLGTQAFTVGSTRSITTNMFSDYASNSPFNAVKSSTYPASLSSVSGAWSARIYFRRSSAATNDTIPIIRFLNGASTSFEVRLANTGTNRPQLLPGGSARSTNMSPATGWWRLEIQADPAQSPKVVVRFYNEDSTGVYYAATLSPTTTEWTEFRYGFYISSLIQTTIRYGDIEVHNDYTLGGVYPSTTPSTTATGVPSTNKSFDAQYNVTSGATVGATLVENTHYTKTANVKYVSGTAYGRYLDLYTPIGTPPAGGWPVVMWAHSGFFIGGSRTDLPDSWRNDLLAAGYAVARVDYVLSGTLTNPTAYGSGGANTGGRYPSHIIDYKRAGAYLRDNAGSLGIDGARMFATGYSAGGYIAAGAVITRGLATDSSGNPLTIDGARAAGNAWGDSYTGSDPLFLGAFVYAAAVDMDKARDWEPLYNNAKGTLINYPLINGHSAFQNRATNNTKGPDIPQASLASHVALNAANLKPIVYVRGTADHLVHWEHEAALAAAMTTYDSTIPAAPAGVSKYTRIDTPNNHDDADSIYNATDLIDWLDTLYTASLAGADSSTAPSAKNAVSTKPAPTWSASGATSPTAHSATTFVGAPSVPIGGAQVPVEGIPNASRASSAPTLTGGGQAAPLALSAVTTKPIPTVTGVHQYISQSAHGAGAGFPPPAPFSTFPPGGGTSGWQDLYIDNYTEYYGTSGPLQADTYTEAYLEMYGSGTVEEGYPAAALTTGIPTPVVLVSGEPNNATITLDAVAVGVTAQPVSMSTLQLPIPGTIPSLPITGIRWDFYEISQRSADRRQRLTKATGKRLTFSLFDPSTASFSLDSNDPEAAILDELVDDVVAYRNNKLMYRGRLVGTTDDVDATKSTVSYSSIDYKGLLFRRTMPLTIDTLATALEQSHIVWRMVTEAQAALGGNLGISLGLLPATGVKRGDKWDLGTAVGEAIDEMSKREYGFEWSVDEQLQFNLHWPVRGQVRGFTAVYGGNVDSFQRTVDPAEYANAVTSVSTDVSGSPIIVRSELQDLGSAPQGRWDKLDSSTATNMTELEQKSRGVLGTSAALTPSYKLHLLPGQWTPEDCWLGDSIKVVIRQGRLNVADYYRVQTIEIEPKDDGTEDVSITVGQPMMSTVNRLWFYGRRITELERR